MAVFTLDLDDSLREKLEAHRKRLGARSLAEAVRRLIDPPSRDVPGVQVGHPAHPTSIAEMKRVRDLIPTVGGAQFGPVARKPGEMLKKGKGKAP